MIGTLIIYLAAGTIAFFAIAVIISYVLDWIKQKKEKEDW
jgi:predicted PurR-regulated permease PerM